MCRSKGIITWHLPFPQQQDNSESHSACGLPVNWSFLPRIVTQLVYFLSCACTSVGLLSDVIHCTSLVGNDVFFLPSDLSKMCHYHWGHDDFHWTTWLSQILLPTNVKCKHSSIPQATNEDTEQARLKTDVESCPVLIAILQLQNSFILTVAWKKNHFIPVHTQFSSDYSQMKIENSIRSDTCLKLWMGSVNL